MGTPADLGRSPDDQEGKQFKGMFLQRKLVATSVTCVLQRPSRGTIREEQVDKTRHFPVSF